MAADERRLGARAAVALPARPLRPRPWATRTATRTGRRLSAGQGLRGTLRTFFGYRGAFMWRMRAGMGDVVFAPLYEALRRRGVRFEFFHRLTNVGLPPKRRAAGESRLRPQPDLRRPGPHARRGAPMRRWSTWRAGPAGRRRPTSRSWRTASAWRREGWNLESHWDRRRAGERTLRSGATSTSSLLGVGLGAVPHVCREILARDARWRRMIENVKTVASQAFQVWLTRGPRDPRLAGPGLHHRRLRQALRHLVRHAPRGARGGVARARRGRRSTSAPCCPTRPSRRATATPAIPRGARRRCATPRRPSCRARSARSGRARSTRAGEFRWDILADAGGTAVVAERTRTRFATQYWRANVNPSDRYVIHHARKLRASHLAIRHDL